MPLVRLLRALCFCALAPAPLLAQGILIGVSPDYPPYAYRDTFGEIRGFDVDAALAICARLGQDCQIEPRPFSDLLRGVWSGELDVAIGGVTATPERADMGNLTCPLMYFPSLDQMFYARSAEVRAEGGSIATVRGSIQERALVDAGYRTMVFETTDAAITAVMGGRADAFFGSEGSLDATAGARQSLVSVGQMQMPPSGTAFLISHRRAELLEPWNAELLRMFLTGAIGDLHLRYGGFNPYFAQMRQLSVDCLQGNRPLF
jgi:ABC-type amino acid transport substrate-binding protein